MAYGFNEVVRDICYEDNEENSKFISLDNIISSEENINWPFTSITNSPHTYFDLDQPPKFDDYIDLVEQDEVAIDTVSCYSLDQMGRIIIRFFDKFKWGESS